VISIINRHFTLAAELQGITGVYATSCHWATPSRLHNPGTRGLQVPDFTRKSGGVATVAADLPVDLDPQPETTTLTSRTPTQEALQARRMIRRSFKLGATGRSLDRAFV
jgi:hypothetical protein